jgi:hypothetical protein
MNIDTRRLVEAFMEELRATASLGRERSLECAVEAVAKEALRGSPDETDSLKGLMRRVGGPKGDTAPIVGVVARLVASKYEIQEAILFRGGRASRSLERIRSLAMVVLRRAGLSLPQLGAAFGLHHTSVMAALQKAAANRDVSKEADALWTTLSDTNGSWHGRQKTLVPVAPWDGSTDPVGGQVGVDPAQTMSPFPAAVSGCKEAA